MAINERLEGLRVILTDDLYMGGESMNEACRAARAAGAATVLSISIAKTIKGSKGCWVLYDDMD